MFPKLYLINVNDRVVGPFDNIESLTDYACAHSLIGQIGDHHQVFPNLGWFVDRYGRLSNATRHYDWIIRNDFYEVIPADIIQEIQYRRIIAARTARIAKEQGFRDRAVPGIHCGRRHRYTYTRRIRTTDENRQTRIYDIERRDILIEDGIELRPVRPKRSDLPSSRDAGRRHREKNWKKQRRTQYKA